MTLYICSFYYRFSNNTALDIVFIFVGIFPVFIMTHPDLENSGLKTVLYVILIRFIFQDMNLLCSLAN